MGAKDRRTMKRLKGVGGLFAVLALLDACGRSGEPVYETGGDPVRGEMALRQYACTACHVIPGVTGADGYVGPSLEHLATRVYIAGILANTPENMIRWLRNPPEIRPGTAMPDLGVTERDARDMAAYLYTLR
jgi:cytochrome c